MRPEELTQLLRRRPFTPLRIHLTDGRKFDIYHPDGVIVLRGRVDIGVGSDPAAGVHERVEYCSLLRIVRVEDLPATPQASPGAPAA